MAWQLFVMDTVKIARILIFEVSEDNVGVATHLRYRVRWKFLPALPRTLCLKKVHPFSFCYNFPNCKPVQIIFGRNRANRIRNRLTHGNF